MIRRVLLSGVITCLVLGLVAQADSLPVDRDFVFTDGIYEDLSPPAYQPSGPPYANAGWTDGLA